MEVEEFEILELGKFFQLGMKLGMRSRRSREKMIGDSRRFEDPGSFACDEVDGMLKKDID